MFALSRPGQGGSDLPLRAGRALRGAGSEFSTCVSSVFSLARGCSEGPTVHTRTWISPHRHLSLFSFVMKEKKRNSGNHVTGHVGIQRQVGTVGVGTIKLGTATIGTVTITGTVFSRP